MAGWKGFVADEVNTAGQQGRCRHLGCDSSGVVGPTHIGSLIEDCLGGGDGEE